VEQDRENSMIVAQMMELQAKLQQMQEEALRDRSEKEALRQRNVALERRVEQLLELKEAGVTVVAAESCGPCGPLMLVCMRLPTRGHYITVQY